MYVSSFCGARAPQVASDGAHELSMAATVLVSIGVLAVWTLINLRRIDEIGWINNAAAIFQLSASFIMIVVLLGATTQYAALDFFTQVHAMDGSQSSFQTDPIIHQHPRIRVPTLATFDSGIYVQPLFV